MYKTNGQQKHAEFKGSFINIIDINKNHEFNDS